MPDQIMIAPSGETGTVPESRVQEALEQGFKRAVHLKAPNGNIQTASYDLVDKFLAAGFTIVHDKENQ